MKSLFAYLATGAIMAAGVPPAVDFSGIQDDLAGEPTRVLTFGTVHLRQQPEDVLPLEDLSLVLGKLEDFAPDIITIETMPGESCERLKRYEAVYPGVWDRYCIDPQPALDSLNTTMPEAMAALWELRDEKPKPWSAADRRRLAALFWATGNPYSAVVQWYKLPEVERKAADGVSEELLEAINRRIASRDESNVIAAVLAHRLGHEEVFPMDDHTADRVIIRAEENPYPVLGEHVWGKAAPEGRALYEETLGLLGSPEGVLAAYRVLNSRRSQELTIAGDFGAAAAYSEVTRPYVAWWQARGLRMAANVVEAAGNHPGAKVLIVVGASHKAYFDAYLDQMHDIELVDVEQVLAD